MKSKYELTISSNYVKSWTYLEGVREFFQNAIDESNTNPDHKFTYKYNESEEILYIKNANCSLDVNTLLLGETSKSDGNSIGLFGEGYKIGILVLLREGKSVTIYNGKDLWETKLTNSRRYKSQIPVIEVSKNYDRRNQDLIVEIANITKEEFNNISDNTLDLKEEYSTGELNKIHTQYGDLILDESEKGRIYVGGLYICSDFELKYSYNINPKNVVLNRDRNMISRFDLIWNTSRIVALAMEDEPDKLYNILDIKDTEYIDNFIKNESKYKLVEYFKEKHGDRIPVTTQEEYNYFKSKNMNPIIVKEKVKSIIGSSSYSSSYKEYDESGSLYNRLNTLVENLKEYVKYNHGLEILNEISDFINDYKSELSDIKVDD